MRSTRWALVVAAATAAVLVSTVAGSDARATGPAPRPVPCAADSDCWRGQLTRTGKKAVRAECCEQGDGSYLCSRVGDDDALMEFGVGACGHKRARRVLVCSKRCGSGCTARFQGTRSN